MPRSCSLAGRAYSNGTRSWESLVSALTHTWRVSTCQGIVRKSMLLEFRVFNVEWDPLMTATGLEKSNLWRSVRRNVRYLRCPLSLHSCFHRTYLCTAWNWHNRSEYKIQMGIDYALIVFILQATGMKLPSCESYIWIPSSSNYENFRQAKNRRDAISSAVPAPLFSTLTGLSFFFVPHLQSESRNRNPIADQLFIARPECHGKLFEGRQCSKLLSCSAFLKEVVPPSDHPLVECLEASVFYLLRTAGRGYIVKKALKTHSTQHFMPLGVLFAWFILNAKV